MHARRYFLTEGMPDNDTARSRSRMSGCRTRSNFRFWRDPDALRARAHRPVSTPCGSLRRPLLGGRGRLFVDSIAGRWLSLVLMPRPESRRAGMSVDGLNRRARRGPGGRAVA